MSTTSLKLPDDLKEKAAAAAHDLGMTTHAFMVNAIRQATADAEQRARFVADANTARSEMLQTGLGYDPNRVRAYLRDRLSGRNASRPTAEPWRD